MEINLLIDEEKVLYIPKGTYSFITNWNMEPANYSVNPTHYIIPLTDIVYVPEDSPNSDPAIYPYLSYRYINKYGQTQAINQSCRIRAILRKYGLKESLSYLKVDDKLELELRRLWKDYDKVTKKKEA